MRISRVLSGALVAAVLVLASTTLLQAHMKLAKSEPAANAVTKPLPHVQVFFTEAPDLKVSKLELKGPSPATKLVQLHVMDKSLMAVVEGDMPDGAYTVSWQAAGTDGHIQKGDFAFTVKR